MSIKGLFSSKTRKERRGSREQLQKDFGEFPPNPLQSKNMSLGKFNIIYLNQIGKYLFNAKSTVALLRYVYRHPNDDYVLLFREKFDNKDPFEGFRNAKTAFVKFWNSIEFLPRVFFVILVISISPIFVIWVLYSLSRMLLSIIKKGDEFERLGGFFSPSPDNRECVYINTKHIGNADHVDHIITHEHIHYLQNVVKIMDNDFKQPSKFIRAPSLVLLDEYCDPSTIYLLERHEVEARLHEIILSFYYKYHELPLTLPAFFDALTLNKELYPFLVIGSFNLSLGTDWENISELYETRCAHMGHDFAFLIGSMKDMETGIRFVLEVLAPMYANLLHYYGDKEASFLFGSQIPRPNLYDRLYLNRQNYEASNGQ